MATSNENANTTGASCTMGDCIQVFRDGDHVDNLGDFEPTRAACWGGVSGMIGCDCHSGRAALTGRQSTTEFRCGKTLCKEYIYEYTCCDVAGLPLGSVDTVGEFCGESSHRS